MVKHERTFAVTVRPLGTLPDDVITYLGADVDDLRMNGAQQYVTLLVPRDDINASYTVLKHVEHHEIHGATHYVDEFEIKVHNCFWTGQGHVHKIVNDVAICWEIEDYDN